MKIFLNQVETDFAEELTSQHTVPSGYLERLPSAKTKITKKNENFIDCFYEEEAEKCEACGDPVSVHRKNNETKNLTETSKLRPKYERLCHRCGQSTSQYFPSGNLDLKVSKCTGTNEPTCDVYMLLRTSNCSSPKVETPIILANNFLKLYPKVNGPGSNLKIVIKATLVAAGKGMSAFAGYDLLS